MKIFLIFTAVPTSVNPEELCINGMSFSQRQSPFANSALVVNVDPEDLGYDPNGNSEETRNPMIGVDWQRSIERKAAYMGEIVASMHVMVY